MKVNKYILIGLVVVVSLTLYIFLFSGGKKKMESIAAPIEPPRLLSPQPEVRTREVRVQPVQETLQWDRDPFTLPSFLMTEKKPEKERERVPLKLLAIMEGARGRVAIIDNEVVGKGDVVAGERVVEIGKETVTLIQDGSKRVITMKEPR